MRIARLASVAALAWASGALAQPRADDAGNSVTRLPAVVRVSAEAAEQRSAIHCDAVRTFCLRAWRQADSDAWVLDLYDRLPQGAAARPARRIPLPAGQASDPEIFSIWPQAIREASGARLIGVERYRRTGFSGGGAGATELVLLRLVGEAEPVEVLAVQTGYTAMIRACFSEADYRSGRPCHQELEFSGTVTLDPAATAGRPRLVLTTAARVFPRGSLRDGWEERPYRRANSVWERDPSCSYRRSFAFDAASGRYAPDRPLPDCSLYTLP